MEQSMSRRSGRSPAADEPLYGCLRTFIRACHSMNDHVKSSLGQQCAQRTGKMRLAVETNLDTRLYMLVPASATFADLEGLVRAAHMKSFSQYGDVAVKELEVKIDSDWFHLEMTPDEFASDLPAQNCSLRAELIRLPDKALTPMEKVAQNVAPRGAEEHSASPVCKTSMPTKHVMESLQRTGRKRKSSSQTCKSQEKRRRPTVIEHKCTSTGLLIEGDANQKKKSLEVHGLAQAESRKVNVPSAIEGSNAVEDVDVSNKNPNLGFDENHVLAANHLIQVSSDKCLSRSSPSSNNDSESSSKGSSGANDRQNQSVDSDLQRNTHIKNIVAAIDDRVETQSFSHESPPNDRELEKGSDEVNLCKKNLINSELLTSVKYDNLPKSVKNIESQDHSQVNGKGLILPVSKEPSSNTDVSNYDEDERYGGRHSDSELEEHHNDTHGIGIDKNDVSRGDVPDDEMEEHHSAHGSSGDESETKLSDSEFEDRHTSTPASIMDDKNKTPRGKVQDNEVKEHHSAHGSSGDESETKLSDDELEEDHTSAHGSSDDEKKKINGKHLSNGNQEHQADKPTATKTSECMGQMGSPSKSACNSKLNRNSLSEQTSPDKTLFEDGQPQSLSPSMNDSAFSGNSTDNSESKIHQRSKKKQAPKAQQKSATIPQNARKNPRTRAAADAKYQPFIDSLDGLDLALVWQCKRATNDMHAVVGSSVPNSMLETQSMNVVVETQDEKVIEPKGPAGGDTPQKDHNQTSSKAQGGMTSPPSYIFQDKLLDQDTDIVDVNTLNRSMASPYGSFDKIMDKCSDLNISLDKPDTSSRRERSNLDTPSPASRRPRERVINQTKDTGDVVGLDLSNKMDTDEKPSTDLNKLNICINGPVNAGLHITSSSRKAKKRSDTDVSIINLDIQMDTSEKNEIARIGLLQDKPRKEIPDASQQEEDGVNGRRHRDIYEFSDHDKPSSSSDPFASPDSHKDVANYSFRQGEHEFKEKANVSNVSKQRKQEASALEENKQGKSKKKRSRGQEVPSVNERKMAGCQGFDVLGRVNGALFKKCPCKYCRTWVASREVKEESSRSIGETA